MTDIQCDYCDAEYSPTAGTFEHAPYCVYYNQPFTESELHDLSVHGLFENVLFEGYEVYGDLVNFFGEGNNEQG